MTVAVFHRLKDALAEGYTIECELSAGGMATEQLSEELMATGAVQFAEVPEELRKRLPKYPVPVAHLGRLAVDATAQGQRLGELLLMDALARIVGAADSIGIHAVEVVAIDENAIRFYLKYGFTALLDDPHHLYISIKTLRKLGLL